MKEENKENRTKDMTIGNPKRIIISFGVPLLLGMLFQQFYSMVDTIIVGRVLGVNELAGVGSTGSINFMVIGFCMGICNGFAIPISQCFGAKDYKNLRKYVANCVWLSVFFAALMTMSVSVFCRDILKLMDTPSDIFEYAYEYIYIIFLGIPVIFLYNILSGIIRALGDSKAPLIFLIISSVINIALDFITIKWFNMSVNGPALATVISQGISGVLCLIYMIKKYDVLRVRKGEWKPERHHMVTLCRMGIPMGLQYSITAIGSVILQTAVNSLGSTAVAAVTAANKVSMFFCCPFDAMGSTMATYAGQNIGAGKPDRVTKGMLSCSLMGLIYSTAACVVLVIFGKELASIFIDKSEAGNGEILQNARLMLVWLSLFYFPLSLVNIIRFTIQGLGYSELAILSGVCEMAARALVGFVFVPMWGFIAVCTASPMAWIFADTFLITAYIFIIKRIKKSRL
ncbi:MAG: MATE family efflux transporter [Lachnospiraceae bacterium]